MYIGNEYYIWMLYYSWLRGGVGGYCNIDTYVANNLQYMF